MIKIEGLSLAYGNKLVLDGFSAELPGRGVTCLKGPSGCGKTTLMRVLAGLEKLRGGFVKGLPEKISFMFQEDRLLPWSTALENVAAVMPKAEKDRAQDFLRMVELENEAHTLPGALSGGMRRRVALARALAYGGGLLLLDEPFKGMDAELIARIAGRIKSAGTPVIAVAHSREETETLGGQVIEMDGPPLRII